MHMYLSLAMTISAGIGFGYGLYRFFRDESALYVRMIIFSVGCAMFGRLFETLQYLVNGELGNGFHVGMLGIIGSFLFLFSANFGQMDSVVDDGSPVFRKTRLISLAAPLVIIAIWCLIAFTKGLNKTTIPLGIETLFIAQASYFHLKHLIIKDVEWGVLKNIRLYNLIGVLNCHCFIASWLNDSGSLIWKISMVLYIFVTFTMLPALVHGANKWKSV